MPNTAILNIRNVKNSAGGPSGYLYNLLKGFNELDGVEIPDFIYMIDETSARKQSNTAGVKNLFPGLRYIAYFFKQGLGFRKWFIGKISNYDTIHVHTSESAIYLRLFCRYKGHIILTPHRPEPIKNEMIEKFKKIKDGKYKLSAAFFDRMEELSYKCSDSFIFPCKEAQAIYGKFPGFEKNARNKNVGYVYTGIQKKTVSVNRVEYRKDHGIDTDAFLLGYVGRHNKIKGYDRLVTLFPMITEMGVDVLVAGGNEGIDFPKSSHWSELGYIQDVQNFMNAVDVVVIPNRNTYFDLVILEALSYGKIVITSNTGGNLSIASDTKALILFDNTETDLLEKIRLVKGMNKSELEELEKDAIRFYIEKCSCKAFAEGYIKALNTVNSD